MKWGAVVEQADEILPARQLDPYMGIAYESPEAADGRRAGAAVRRPGRRRGAARDGGVEHEPRRSFGTRDHSDLESAEEVTLAIEFGRLYREAGGDALRRTWEVD